MCRICLVETQINWTRIHSKCQFAQIKQTNKWMSALSSSFYWNLCKILHEIVTIGTPNEWQMSPDSLYLKQTAIFLVRIYAFAIHHYVPSENRFPPFRSDHLGPEIGIQPSGTSVWTLSKCTINWCCSVPFNTPSTVCYQIRHNINKTLLN